MGGPVGMMDVNESFRVVVRRRLTSIDFPTTEGRRSGFVNGDKRVSRRRSHANKAYDGSTYP